ncbi:MAG TPA: potassium-transporting ATPase subunit C [Tepidisphaeraceae bacterium]
MKDQTLSTPAGNLLSHLWASISATIILAIICSGLYPLAIFGIGQLISPVQANGSLLKKDGSFTTRAGEAVGSALIGQNFSLPQYFHPRPSAAGNGYDSTSSGGSNLGPLSDKLINGASTPAATQPSVQPETLAYDGVRLRTLHYAIDNGLSFKLYNQRADGTDQKVQVPIKQFEDSQGNLLDVKLVDAFPHPVSDTPDRIVLTAGPFFDSQGKEVLIPGDAVTASGSGLDPHISPANAELQINRIAAARHITAGQIRSLVQQFTDGPSLGFLGDPGVNVLRLNLAVEAKYPVPVLK